MKFFLNAILWSMPFLFKILKKLIKQIKIIIIIIIKEIRIIIITVIIIINNNK
jgi:hypothetical protein